jgi:DNA-binding NarL/FixJ family response regulator
VHTDGTDLGVSTTRVLIVDDDVPTRIGLRSILDAESGVDVVGEAADGREACNLVDSLEPDVVLMDVRMRPMDGITATRTITSDAHSLDRPRVIVLTTFDHDEYVFGALRAGASGFLLKRTPAEELVDAIRVVAEGEALLTPEATRRLVADFAKRNHAPTEARDATDWLTPREREVLVLIAHGLTNSEIASTLNVSLETIKTHVKRIFTKIGVHDRAQAVIAAYEARLVAPAP